MRTLTGVSADRVSTEARPTRSRASILVIDGVALVVIATLAALGVWQVHRLAWKRDLIARVEARVHARAVSVPSPEQWPRITDTDDAYRHVEAVGTFLDVQPAFVQAVTDLGGGFWVMAPLRLADGSIVFVNRGFVPPDKRSAADALTPSSTPTKVTGLLRMSEPGGAFLRSNDADADRWYSRDVQAIAGSRSLVGAAPFFIDAEKAPGQTGLPVAGLTIVDFPNNHLAYAITWFALSLMLAVAVAHANIRAWKTHRSISGTRGRSIA